MADVTIRHSQKKDVKEIAQMIKSLAEFHKLKVFPDENTLLRDGFESHPPWFHILVAQTKDSSGTELLAGMICYSFMYAASRGRMGFMSGFYVAPEYRNMGVGEKLYNAVKENIFAKKCVSFRFFTSQSNLNALSFYKKRGAKDLYGENQLLAMSVVKNEETIFPLDSTDTLETQL